MTGSTYTRGVVYVLVFVVVARRQSFRVICLVCVVSECEKKNIYIYIYIYINSVAILAQAKQVRSVNTFLVSCS